MRLFRVNDDGFTEYIEKDFSGEHMEKALEDWLESNPHAIVEDGKLLIIGRQIATNLNTYIDLLAVDRSGNVVVIELKRDRTPRETLAQALEYAAFAAELGYEDLQGIFQDHYGHEDHSLSEYHRAVFELGETEAVSFNKDQRIVIVGGSIVPSIKQTAKFLCKRGLRITCVEFNFFRTDSGEELLSTDIVVGGEPVTTGGSIPKQPLVNRAKFLQSCDEAGRAVFDAIFRLSELNNLPVRWGVEGFSLNVDLSGKLVNLGRGYRRTCVFGQSFYTTFGEIVKKAGGSPELVNAYRGKSDHTGLFTVAGNEMKYVIQQMPTNEQLEELIELIAALAKWVKEQALAGSSQPNSE